MNDSHRFRISISYSGQKREFVKQVDQELLKYLDHSEVFYDQRYSALMARPDLDGWLRKLFREGSDLVVCFLSKAHEQSPWCQVESNAVRESFQSNSDSPPPLLFTDGDYDVGMGFSLDHAQSTEGLTPQQVAEMILKRFQFHYPNVTVKSPTGSGKRFLIEFTIIVALLGLITYLNQNSGLDQLIPKEWLQDGNSSESFVGVIGFIMLIVSISWGMLRAKHFLRPRDRNIEYVDPPTGSGGPHNSNWEAYARELEEYTEKERQNLAESLLEMRQRRLILMASIFLSVFLVIGHTILWLVLENHDKNHSAFLPQITTAETVAAGNGASSEWTFREVVTDHTGHLWLAGFYLTLVFVFSFVVSNRTRRPFATAGFLGAWQPLYLGIIYVLFISTQNYRGLFETGLDQDGFFNEPGNFYVAERIIIIPALCWIIALFAGWLGLMARGNTKPLPLE